MMTQIEAQGLDVRRRAPDPGLRGLATLTVQCKQRAAGAAALAAMLLAGCAGGHATARDVLSSAPYMATSAGSVIRIPHPDYADPASVAAAFYTAWASVDADHDTPTAYAARCAPMATSSLRRQLAASQPATAAWQAMRREHLVSQIRVRAVKPPDGAPAPTSSTVYLRVYATRVTTTTAGRTAAADGVTLRLGRSGGRWLVSAILFY